MVVYLNVARTPVYYHNRIHIIDNFGINNEVESYPLLLRVLMIIVTAMIIIKYPIQAVKIQTPKALRINIMV